MRGLYGARGADGQAVKLIELSVAGADARPASPYGGEVVDAPKRGYWFRTIRQADEVGTDPDRFAFCAYPDVYLKGRVTFIINEGNTIFRKDLGHDRGIEVFPADLEKEGWLKVD